MIAIHKQARRHLRRALVDLRRQRCEALRQEQTKAFNLANDPLAPAWARKEGHSEYLRITGAYMQAWRRYAAAVQLAA